MISRKQKLGAENKGFDLTQMNNLWTKESQRIPERILQISLQLLPKVVHFIIQSQLQC